MLRAGFFVKRKPLALSPENVIQVTETFPLMKAHKEIPECDGTLSKLSTLSRKLGIDHNNSLGSCPFHAVMVTYQNPQHHSNKSFVRCPTQVSKLDDDLLAHMALHLLPAHHKATRQVIIPTADSLNTAHTINGLLSQINELIRDSENFKINATALNNRSKAQSYAEVNYECCLNGTHNSTPA